MNIKNINENKLPARVTVRNISEQTVTATLEMFSFQLYNVEFKALNHAGKVAEVKQYAAEFFTHCRDAVLNRY